MKPYRIRFVKGTLDGKEFQIGETPVIIGRSRGSDIRIPDEIEFQDVSRSHVMLVNQGDALLAVNMSSHKTLIDGHEIPPSHKARLVRGARITMGESTEFRVLEPDDGMFELKPDETQNEEEEERKPSGNTQATVCAETSPDETKSTQTFATANAQTGDLTASMTGALEGDCDDAAGNAPFIAEAAEPDALPDDAHILSNTALPTDQFPTVIVSQEELDKLIEDRRKAKLFKTYKRMVVFAGSFLAVAVSYLCMRPHPETELTWPKRADGRFDDKQIVFNTPLGENAVGILCPYGGRTRVRAPGNGVTVVDTYIGRDRDVPLRLELTCEKSPLYLTKSRNALFDEKRRMLEESGGWNFMATSPVAFLGPDNGIPYREVQYLRSEKTATETMQWFGHLMFAVHGDCALTFTREIPAVEQWRGGAFLARETLLMFGNQIIDGHWEGRNDFRDEPIESMLAEADGLLSLRSPLLWKDAEFLLQSVMIKCGGSGKNCEEALKRLVRLRGDQRTEFNRLKALANKEKAFMNSQKEVSPALEEALRVFSSPDDKRNVLLKKGRWE